jgi:hypothetical protein
MCTARHVEHARLHASAADATESCTRREINRAEGYEAGMRTVLVEESLHACTAQGWDGAASELESLSGSAGQHQHTARKRNLKHTWLELSFQEAVSYRAV